MASYRANVKRIFPDAVLARHRRFAAVILSLRLVASSHYGEIRVSYAEAVPRSLESGGVPLRAPQRGSRSDTRGRMRSARHGVRALRSAPARAVRR
jgi:hypothetical protein